MSSIKPKTGNCLDCPDGIIRPLIAKRCQHHYWLYRELLSDKKEQKPKAKIPRRSKKRMIQELQYNANVKVFLGKPENQICPVTGQQTDQVHHKKGRIESLLLDQRYWLAVSDEGHREIELNPKWAKEMGYSLSRLENTETTN